MLILKKWLKLEKRKKIDFMSIFQFLSFFTKYINILLNDIIIINPIVLNVFHDKLKFDLLVLFIVIKK